MYFKEFPEMLYDFKYGRKTKTAIVKDITRNVRIRRDLLANITLYDEYDIVDGETPEIIAEKIYGNAEYHWIVMLANGRYDYLTDFPQAQEACRRACLEFYNEAFTVDSWSYDGNIITVVKPNHGLLTSPTTTVTIKGATAATNAPNGTFTVTAVTFDTFSFTVSTAPTGTASGIVTVKPAGRENYINHYVDARGFRVNSDAPGAVSVTNLEDSRRLNEEKGRIKIVSPQLVSRILKDYKELL
jgi:hypothetical protein